MPFLITIATRRQTFSSCWARKQQSKAEYFITTEKDEINLRASL